MSHGSPDRGPSPKRPEIRFGLRQGLGVVARMRFWTGRAQRDDPESPAVISGGDERSRRVCATASRMARDGREDDAAVQELRQLAAGRRKTLRKAEEMARLGGRHHDSAIANRAHRLLVAARDERSPVPADPDERAVFELLDRLLHKDRPDEEIWRDLRDRAPELGVLRSAVGRGEYGTRYEPDQPDAPQRADPLDRGRRAEEARGRLALHAAVQRIAGPKAPSSDPVIRARRTCDWIDFFLVRQHPDSGADLSRRS